MSYVGNIRKLIGKEPLILTGGRAILENAEGEILFHKRTDFTEMWSLPGGSSEIGESIEATIVREVKEETGLTMIDFQPIGFSSNPAFEFFEYPNGDKVQLFAMVFYCKKWKGQLRVSNESPKLDFFPNGKFPRIRKNEERSLTYLEKYKSHKTFKIF